jgi:ADAMTS-4, putative
MSPNRGTRGETQWSACSAATLKSIDAPCLKQYNFQGLNNASYDHNKYMLRPGQYWDANDQCKLFLKDEMATVYGNKIHSKICDQSILCKASDKIGYYSIGPALHGTYCGDRSWCIDGKCIPWEENETLSVIEGGWSDWTVLEECKSDCLENSMGRMIKIRKCNNPKPKNSDYCKGEAVSVNICSDHNQCLSRFREKPNSYASRQCKLFSNVLKNIAPHGIQAPYNPRKHWQSCAIYCMKNGTWYTPRLELNDLSEYDSFFPDGTLCHQDLSKGPYYCQKHICLPFKSNYRQIVETDDPFRSANLSDSKMIAAVQSYYTLSRLDLFSK